MRRRCGDSGNFGLNRSLPARFAEAGYFAVAPALFDRAKPGIELDYAAAAKKRGLALKDQVDADSLFDVSAAIAAAGPVTVVGFCWGGSLAWRAATCLTGLAAHCPVLAHFGEQDEGIPMEGVNTFIKAQADSDPPVTTHNL